LRARCRSSARKVFFASRADMDLKVESRADPCVHLGQNGRFLQAVSDTAGRRVAGGFRGLEGRFSEGKIKAALRSSSKSLTGLVFLRACRSGREPLRKNLSTIPMLFSAL
jgi:hypothetical protein